MRLTRYFPALALLLLSIPAANAASQAKWLETSHDFGAFDEDMGRVSTDFRLVNTGNEPLIIYAARASCGCTIPSYTKEPIAPRDTATIKVVYDPAGRPGNLTRKSRLKPTATPGRQFSSLRVWLSAHQTLYGPDFRLKLANLNYAVTSFLSGKY